MYIVPSWIRHSNGTTISRLWTMNRPKLKLSQRDRCNKLRCVFAALRLARCHHHPLEGDFKRVYYTKKYRANSERSVIKCGMTQTIWVKGEKTVLLLRLCVLSVSHVRRMHIKTSTNPFSMQSHHPKLAKKTIKPPAVRMRSTEIRVFIAFWHLMEQIMNCCRKISPFIAI